MPQLSMNIRNALRFFVSYVNRLWNYVVGSQRDILNPPLQKPVKKGATRYLT